MPQEKLFREEAFVAGRWVSDSQWQDVENPATGAIIGRVPILGATETRAAISAAAEAMEGWKRWTARHRSDVLLRFHGLMITHREELAKILTLEQGKPLPEARGEIDYAASFLRWFAEEAVRVYGETIPTHDNGKRLLVLREPVGVVAAITPWNFPSAMITRKLAPAFAAGCGLVLKPAPQTPFSALALARLAELAGVPEGLFSVITGNAEAIGREMTENTVVRKLTFTGSTAVGAKLYAQSAPSIKKLSLELGGNAPFIIFDDADIDAAVSGAVLSKFRNAGQTCVCANRFYVQAAVYERFIERFSAAIRDLIVGNGMNDGVTVGPLIDGSAIRKVERHIADAVDKGGSVVVGGDVHAQGPLFFQPTLIRDASADMAIMAEETFGPVAAVVRFETEQEVIAAANATSYGLAAYFYARDLGRVWRVAEALETGIVGVNTGIISSETAPFGGVKASGLGREGSRHGLDDFLETKYVCMAL